MIERLSVIRLQGVSSLFWKFSWQIKRIVIVARNKKLQGLNYKNAAVFSVIETFASIYSKIVDKVFDFFCLHLRWERSCDKCYMHSVCNEVLKAKHHKLSF